ncbi:MAG: dTMP kinase [Anaerolineales bacterium]|jgi:dTMP kinase
MFITFEGTEGCGKTSQIPLLALYLRQEGYKVVTTREPGGTPIGDQVRAILSDLTNTAMQPRTEVLLFQASRAQHVDELIVPHLQTGHIVLCDRFSDSTLAYQGYGYQRYLGKIEPIIDFATGGLKPDLTLLLDMDVEVGLLRRASGGEWNRLDAMDVEFYQRVREGYHKLVEAEPERWVVINADQSVEMVQAEIRAAVAQRLRITQDPA